MVGEIYGEALYLRLPAKGRVQWRVLSPNRLEPSDMTGDYDRVSKHAFRYSRKNRKVLHGGTDDAVALELIDPKIEALDASTLLTLRPAP